MSKKASKVSEEVQNLKLSEIRRIADGETEASPEVFREALRLAVLADDMGEEFAEQRREMRRMVNWQRDLLKALRSPKLELERARQQRKRQLAELDRKARQAEHPDAVLLKWLREVKAGTATGPCQGITVQRADSKIRATPRGALKIVAWRLTGKPIERYAQVQREIGRNPGAKSSQKRPK